MRAKVGDPPRTMAQKIFLGRVREGVDPAQEEMVEVKIDQVVLSRTPHRVFAEAEQAGLKRAAAEVAVAYDVHCVTDAKASSAALRVPGELLAHGIQLAKPGVGFAAAVHLERFASPARLCLTDEPRLTSCGGIGLLSITAPPGLLAHALVHGRVQLRTPRSIQILISGKMRPFVCARDAALELLRRGLADTVRALDAKYGAPVVLEFAGPGVRLLSVADRSVLASLAPQVGASGSLFLSDERTEVFLRDQRRSKAHRVLVPDAGAPFDEVLNIDFAAVDPLLRDEKGEIRAVRELLGRPVSQVVLGGDTGATLRDFFAAAQLLKSKRVPSGVDFLLAIPSRQTLEVLATSGALAELVATGARLVEPDGRILTGDMYAPLASGASMRTSELEPRAPSMKDPPPAPIVASAETISFAVASGTIGDPRSFKRPVRVTVPRILPTDDVLIVRDKKGLDTKKGKREETVIQHGGVAIPWNGSVSLELVENVAIGTLGNNGKTAVAVLCSSLDDVRQLAARAADLSGIVRAVIAPFIPSGLVMLFSGAGIAALQIDSAHTKRLKAEKAIVLPPFADWSRDASLSLATGGGSLPVTWLARGPERHWTGAGAVRPGMEVSESRAGRTPQARGAKP